MALGCAFIFLIVIWLFRRHQRKQRAKRAAEQFAKGSTSKARTGWRWKLLRFGEKLFCHARSRRVPIIRVEQAEDVKLATQLRMTEEARPVASDFWFNDMHPSEEGRREEDLVQLIGSYNPMPEAYYNPNNRHIRILGDQQRRSLIYSDDDDDSSSQHSAPSMYSQVTGLPHNVPEPRQPLKSRFSMSTFATKEVQKKSHSSGKKAFWK